MMEAMRIFLFSKMLILQITGSRGGGGILLNIIMIIPFREENFPV